MPPRRTAGTLGLTVSLLPALVGLAASVMLAIDYARPTPVFCAENIGCAALRNSSYAEWLGVSTPTVGVAGFLLLAVVTLVNGPLARTLQLLGAGVAGLMGLFFIVVQVRIGRYCPFCLVADSSGIVAALAATVRLWIAGDEPAPRAAWGAGAGLVTAAAGVPLVMSLFASPVPRVIREEQARTPPGQVTLVDFVDFECPFCRMTNAALEPLLEARRGQVRVVRRMVPLTRIHPHAIHAARAQCCAERLGQGDAMASALFTAPVEELTPEGCARVAEQLHLPMQAYQDCIADPATNASIERDKEEFRKAGGVALPTLWIDGQVLLGMQTSEELAAALDKAAARAGKGG
jgi:protein-disulfide isomerase